MQRAALPCALPCAAGRWPPPPPPPPPPHTLVWCDAEHTCARQTDDFALAQLLQLQRGHRSLLPRQRVYCYGGGEPAFSLLPPQKWPSRHRDRTARTGDGGSGSANTEVVVRAAGQTLLYFCLESARNCLSGAVPPP
jgi:hypothetical protein